MLTPERVVVAEARRSLTTLSLYGYRVDGVIAAVYAGTGYALIVVGAAVVAGWLARQFAVT